MRNGISLRKVALEKGATTFTGDIPCGNCGCRERSTKLNQCTGCNGKKRAISEDSSTLKDRRKRLMRGVKYEDIDLHGRLK